MGLLSVGGAPDSPDDRRSFRIRTLSGPAAIQLHYAEPTLATTLYCDGIVTILLLWDDSRLRSFLAGRKRVLRFDVICLDTTMRSHFDGYRLGSSLSHGRSVLLNGHAAFRARITALFEGQKRMLRRSVTSKHECGATLTDDPYPSRSSRLRWQHWHSEYEWIVTCRRPGLQGMIRMLSPGLYSSNLTASQSHTCWCQLSRQNEALYLLVCGRYWPRCSCTS